jgi:hypothetical protein
MRIEWRSDAVTDIAIMCGYCGFEGDAKALMKKQNVRALLIDIRVEEASARRVVDETAGGLRDPDHSPDPESVRPE